MTKNLSHRGENCALLTLAAALILGLASLFAHHLSGSVALLSPAFFAALTSAISLLSYFALKMERRANEERFENESAIRGAGELFATDRTLFGDRARAFGQFEKYFLPSFTTMIATGEAFAAFAIWRKALETQLKTPFEAETFGMGMLFAAGAMAFVLFLLGNYCLGIAATDGNSRLRPPSSLLLFSSFYIVFVIASFLASYFAIKSESWNFRNPDPFVMKVSSAIFALFAIDHVFGVLLYFYRPDGAKGRDLPVYDSRIAGFFSRPEAAFDNLNEILEYQFGFKISRNMLANFATRIFLPLFVFQIFSLLLLSCVAVVPSQKRGFVERFGKLVRGDIPPGLHFKLPWPIESITHVPADRVFSINCGSILSGDSNDPPAASLLWNSLPEDVPLFLTSAGASREPGKNDGSRFSMKLIAAELSVKYLVENPLQYKYSSVNAEKILGKLASSVLSAYLFGINGYSLSGELLSEAEKAIAQKINDLARSLELGLRVSGVSFVRIQPPSKSETALTFHKAMIEEQNSITELNEAEGYANMLLPSSQTAAFSIISDAEAYSSSRIFDAMAQSDAFRMKKELHEKHGRIYPWISYLDILSKGLASPSKTVIAADVAGGEVMSLDLKSEFNPELLDMAPPPKMEK